MPPPFPCSPVTREWSWKKSQIVKKYYSVTINESKETFRIVFCCFSAIKDIVAPSSTSNPSVKLIFREIFIFICLDKSMQ